jgi:hypothetical protein
MLDALAIHSSGISHLSAHKNHAPHYFYVLCKIAPLRRCFYYHFISRRYPSNLVKAEYLQTANSSSLLSEFPPRASQMGYQF